MKHKIYSREVVYKNHRAILVGPALQFANENSQYYLELKRTDLRDEYAVRFLLKGYHAIDDLIYLVNLRQFPTCMLGVFAIKNTACRLTKKPDSISIRFKESYAVQYGRDSVSFFENFEQEALIYCYPARLFKAISRLLMAENKKPLFITDRDDWLFANDIISASLGNSFLTSNYISRSAFQSLIFNDLVKFQKDLMQSGFHEKRHPGYYESSALYCQVKKELSQTIAGLLAKVDYLTNYVDDEEYCDYDKTSSIVRFALGLDYQANILSGNLFNEDEAPKIDLHNHDDQEYEIVEQSDNFDLLANNNVNNDEQIYEITTNKTYNNENKLKMSDYLIIEEGVSLIKIKENQKVEQGVVCQVEISTDNLKLPNEIIKKLKDVGITYVEQLKGLSKDELCEYKGIGGKTAEKILFAIA